MTVTSKHSLFCVDKVHYLCCHFSCLPVMLKIIGFASCTTGITFVLGSQENTLDLYFAGTYGTDVLWILLD